MAIYSNYCENQHKTLLTLHLISRYGCNVVAWLTIRSGLILLNKYNVDRHATNRLLVVRPSVNSVIILVQKH